MKWIVGGALLYLFLQSRGTAGAATAPGLTNQGNPGTPLSVAQGLAKLPGQIMMDITGSPTTPANNAASVANPASNPNWSGIPVPPNPSWGSFIGYNSDGKPLFTNQPPTVLPPGFVAL